MGSFDISYDADEDVLEAAFDVVDDHMARTISLNDHILLQTDIGLKRVWSITFYSFRRLLEASETELTGIAELPEPQTQAILALLSCTPGSLFFDLTDPEGRIARLRAPRLDLLVSSVRP